ncbi:helix-turn-helix domain-containing protein [Curtobacterium luteum]|uniref:helix-turn-helix domain-containing protein n=1 Tax=Curtobacterium luteum TaxID=33881 RepID=UPI00381E7BE4
MVVLASATTNTLRSDPLGRSTAPIRGYGRQRMTTRLTDRIVNLHGQGRSTRQIAEELSVSKTAVLRALTKAGVEKRPRGGRS